MKLNGAVMFEPVIIDVFGSTAQQWRPIPNWRAEYQKYLLARCDAHVQIWLMKGKKHA
jgi:hypothetical protein